MRKIIAHITGGRPMVKGEYRFTDIISGEPVYYFTDYFGREWLARHKWSLFRVPSPHSRRKSDD